MARYAEIAIPVPVRSLFTYRVPEELESELVPGHRVEVPWGKGLTTGFVVKLADETAVEANKLKSITSILDDEEPSILPEIREVCEFAASYYLAPPGEVFRAAVPANMASRGKRILRLARNLDETAPALVSGSLSDEDVELLAQLGGKGRDARPMMRRDPSLRSRIARLERDGWISAEEELHDSSGVRWEQWVMLTDREVQPTSTQQEHVLRLLEGTGGEAPKRAILDAGGSSSAIQTLMKKGKLVGDRRPAEADIDLLSMAATSKGDLALNRGQLEAIATVTDSLGSFHPFLLQGVTGSGKTEVYIEIMREAVRRGRKAILMVPEIALTPAVAARLRERFGDRIAILHSNLTPGERWDQWRRARRGETDVSVGPRSALFTPFEDLGVIIVDEEGDGAYKQDETPRYNARDLAVVRARASKCPVILGSATPSLESRYNVEQGRYTHLTLPARIGASQLPEIEIVDLRNERAEKGDKGMVIFSEPLKNEMTRVLLEGQQIIILINRRGYAPFLLCRECENDFRCANCSVTRTVHRRDGQLVCHYCGYRTAIPAACYECGGEVLQPIGFGTEKVEERFMRDFPEVPAAVLDRDSVRRKGSLLRILRDFRDGRTRVLIGTQIVSKGHDFPGVTLTGVLNADSVLGYPDFRSAEKTFYLLTQVAGRSGRGEDAGRVMIQTAWPHHHAIQSAISQDYEAFYASEIEFRSRFHYPPITGLIAIRLRGNEQPAVERTARRIGDRLERFLGSVEDARMQGPAPAPLERLKGMWRYQILVRSRQKGMLRSAVDRALTDAEVSPGVEVTIDVDPLNIL
ncbi:MAG: primosomal protein N' [Acidobacteria bacterium]|nr:primosomal protein N' [Acidobacteriota bacterium]